VLYVKEQHLKASQFYAGNGTLFLYAALIENHENSCAVKTAVEFYSRLGYTMSEGS